MCTVTKESLVSTCVWECANTSETHASRFGVPNRRRYRLTVGHRPRSAVVRHRCRKGIARERRVDRYYDPATDQFISVDPDVGATGQPYAFTGDDPINGNDPLGLLGNCGGQPGDCVQTGGHPTIANPQSSSSSSASGGVYLDQPTPTVVVASAGGFETTVSGDVTFSGTKTKTTAGISPNGDIQAQIGQFDLTFAPNGVAQAEVDIHNCSGSFSHAGLSWSCTKSYTGTSGPVTATASITVTFQVTPSEQAQAAEQRELSLYPEFAAVGAAIVTGGAQIIAGCISGSDAVCIAPA